MNAHATFEPNCEPKFEPKFESKLEPKHAHHRRNARLCALLAKDAASPLDRWTLLTMQQSWLALAENEEWLAGRRGPPKPARLNRPRRDESQMAFWGS